MKTLVEIGRVALNRFPFQLRDQVPVAASVLQQLAPHGMSKGRVRRKWSLKRERETKEERERERLFVRCRTHSQRRECVCVCVCLT